MGEGLNKRLGVALLLALLGAAVSGLLLLQHHGEEAWFRNVRIRPLP